MKGEAVIIDVNKEVKLPTKTSKQLEMGEIGRIVDGSEYLNNIYVMKVFGGRLAILASPNHNRGDTFTSETNLNIEPLPTNKAIQLING